MGENLTNEVVRKRFVSQFELVGYAIRLAENMIKTGRGPYVKTETQNPAYQVMSEIEAGVDRFEEIPKERVDYQAMEKIAESYEKNDNPRASERKRARKILVD